MKEGINSLLKDHIAVLSSNKSSEDGEHFFLTRLHMYTVFRTSVFNSIICGYACSLQ